MEHQSKGVACIQTKLLANPWPLNSALYVPRFFRQNANDSYAGSGVEIWTLCMTKTSTEGYFPCRNALLIVIKISTCENDMLCGDTYSSPSRTGPAVDCFLPTPPLPRTFASIASPKDLMQATFFSQAMSRWVLALWCSLSIFICLS